MMRSARLRRALRQPPREWLRGLEAVGLLAAAWPAVRVLPFRWYAPLLGSQCLPSGAADPRAEAERIARDVRIALVRAGRLLPWTSTCLMRALAGQAMLRCRGCRGTVFLGAARDQETELAFHAWITVGGIEVAGGHEASRYTVVATFH